MTDHTRYSPRPTVSHELDHRNGVAAKDGDDPGEIAIDPERVERIVAQPIVEGFLGAPDPGAVNPIPEGPAFDRQGRLYFVSAFPDAAGHKVFRLDTKDLSITPILADEASGFASLVIHKDGRLFLLDLFGGPGGKGRIAVADPDGTGLRTLIDSFEGTPIVPDDLVFDSRGNFYYNDFQGNALHPTGRVIRVSAEGDQRLVAGGLAMPNGIALTGKEDRLWISEHYTNRLISLHIDPDGTALDSRVHAYFSGGLVDSTTLDSQDNIYQAVYDGGRVEVMDRDANLRMIVTPGPNPLRDYIRATHVAIEPGTNTGYLVAGGAKGIGIFTFPALAQARTPFSHQR